jgi:hypothetical protein
MINTYIKVWLKNVKRRDNMKDRVPGRKLIVKQTQRTGMESYERGVRGGFL